ncbi:hypothetical protein [Natrarchaeobaculum sulfurireducens]|uniref:Uncharacterized protein n=1 Tax=Natrarchaeobaculum sulfurireducens TaxID=2044521 RepID=A0A346PGJ9_9EURY|nr:hypothetical protein [Natrarchaeobaculum sulfurireducens]AXR78644.1 hypothetical protein AArc1_2329 [Natrarchaeobaculum sulfurireducens]
MTDPFDRRRRVVRTVLVVLALEEWRLHTRLFGGWRFAAFPVLIAGLAIGATVALLETGTAAGTVVLGLHALAAGFGLYSGTAGFAGSDMLENVFGRLSLLLSTVETLPLSRRWLLGAFLLKDAAFYAVVFVLPMATAAIPLGGFTAGTVPAVGALWGSLSLVFVAGMALTVAGIALRTQSVPGWAIVSSIALVAVAVWMAGGGSSVRSMLVPLEAPLTVATGLVVATATVAVGSLVLYDPTYARPDRTASDRFANVADALPLEHDALVTKTLLDLARSSGGVWKPFVSAAILLALVAGLVGVVHEITGIEPAPGIFFGAVLGLSAFTTYNWLTQFDSLEDYLVYPVSVEHVFRAKRTAFVVVGTPAVFVPYLGAVVWFEATVVDAAVGALVLAGYGLYYYGLTVYVAGFDPNEFLFDAVRFGVFTLGVAVAVVPTLVAGFVVVPPSTSLAAVLAAASLAFGTVGYVLSSRAGPRWDVRYRTQ